MCDCFHLAFPNWHGSPGTGAGRRLKGPEPEDDSVCEDPPEFLEGERPRPQGSSPVNDYPDTEKYTDIDKQREEEIDDPHQKSSGNKKGKKGGFGSFFEKRSKMSQEECPESGVIVKTAKEACPEGLVVSGGGTEGIFIKEVKAESPAAKHPSVQEGDQILSATVYFDNVSYEDAIQILEHAQPYKMEFCLKRKPPAASDLESSTVERQEVAPGEEGAGPLERGRIKTQRRPDARISWPKFPSFSRGRKSHFKRSHSTSEAEEQRKLEMSPTTSDTESPMKTQEPDKDKKTKKQKIKLSKLKIKGVKSKSVEQQDKDSIVPVSRSLENVQPQQTVDVSDKHSPQPQDEVFGESPKIDELDQKEKKGTTKIRNEYYFPDVSGSVPEISQHKAQLISLDKTLKTTDISDFLADRGSSSTKRSPEVKKKKKKERSELKVNIQGKEKEDSSPEGLLKSPRALILKTSSDSLKTPDMGARTQDLLGNTVDPNVISHTEFKGCPIAIDINSQRIHPNKPIPKVDKGSSAENVISTTTVMGDVDICLPKVDMSLNMSDVGLLKKSPMIKSEKHKKERSILIRDSERYGIRPRGPMADISMTRKYLGSSVNETNLPSSKGNLLDSVTDTSKPKSPKMKTSFPSVKVQEITANRKDASIKMETLVDIQSPQLKIQASKYPKETNIGDCTEKIGMTVPKFKMPKIEPPDFNVHDPTVRTEVEASKAKVDVKSPKVEERMHMIELDSRQPPKQVDIKTELLKREDIDIPGMEASALAGNVQTPAIKLPKTGKIHASVPTVEIYADKIQADMKVHEIKDTTSKTDLQTFKLPKLDTSSFDVHQQITKSDVTAEKVKLDLTADVSQHKTPACKIPMIDSPDPDAHEPISMAQVSFSEAKFEIQGSKIEGKLPMAAVDGGMLEIASSHLDKTEKPEIKLPKREDIEIPGMESTSTAGNIQIIATQLPGIEKKDASDPSVEIQAKKIQPEINVENIKRAISNISLPTFKLPKMDSDFEVYEQITKRDVNTEKSKSPKQHRQDQIFHAEGKKGKFKIPPVPEYDVSFPNLKSDVQLTKELGKERETGEIKCISDNEVHIAARTDITLQKPHIEICKPDIKVPQLSEDITLPSLPTVKLPKVGISVTKTKKEEGPSLDNVTAEIPDVELGGTAKFQVPHIKIPTFGIPKLELKGSEVPGDMHLPSTDISLKKQDTHIKGQVSIDGTSIDIDTQESKLSGKIPEADIKGPSIGAGSAIDTDIMDAEPEQGSKFKHPKFGISIPKLKGPGVDISTSKPDVDISLPDVTVEAQLPGVEVEVKSVEGTQDIPEVDSKGGDLKVKKPSISFPKFGFTKTDMKAPEMEADIKKGITVPEMVDVTGPEIDIKRQETEADTDTDIGGPPNKFKMPTFTLPKIGVTVPTVKAHFPEGKAEITEAERKTPSFKVDMDHEGPGTENEKQEGKFELPKVKIPKIDLSLSKPKGPQLHQEVPKAEAVPQIDVVTKESKGPSLDTQAEIEAAEHGKFKMPHITLPSFGFSKPEITGPKISGDVHLPSVDIAVTKPNADITASDISADVTSASMKLWEPPEVEIKDYSVDLECPDMKADMKSKEVELEGQGGKFKLPKFGISFPKEKGPAVDISASKPDVDISLPEVTIKTEIPGVEVEGPSLEENVDISEVEGKGLDITVKKPKISLPKFGFSKPDFKAPEIDISLPKGEAPAVDIKGYSVDVEGPDVDIGIKGKGTELEGQGSKFKLPKFGISFPKTKGPAVDISVSKPDVHISLPEVTAEAKLPGVVVEGPSVEGTIDIPELDSKDVDVKVKKPKISLPKFGFSKPDVKAPEIDISLPKGDISLAGGSVEVKKPEMDITAPDIDDKEDSDIKGSPSKFKVPTLKLPKFGITAPKVKAEVTDLSADITVPEIETPSGKAIIDQEGIGIEIEKPAGKFQLPKMKIPNIDVKVPTLKGPEMSQEIHKAEYKISVPDKDIVLQEPKGDIKGSSFDGQAEFPDIEAGAGEQGRFKMPHIKFPSFGFSKPEITAPKISGNINLPPVDIDVTKPNVDINVPDMSADVTSAAVKLPETDLAVSGEAPAVDIKGYSVDVEGPDVDIGIKGKGTEVEGQGSKFKLPKFGISLPKTKGPAVDFSVSKPDVDISLPEVTAEAKLPGVVVEGPSVEGTIDIPELDSKDVDVKVKKPKISLPKFGFSKPDVKAPEIDISLPKGEISLAGGSVEVKKPEMDITAPDIDDKEDSDIKGSPSKFKVPTLKLPKFGITAPKVKAEVTDLSADITVPEIETPSGKAIIYQEGIGIEIEKPAGKFQLPKIKIPNIDVKVPTLKGPEMSQEIPKAEYKISVPDKDIVLQEPKVDIKGSSFDGQAEFPDIEAGAGEQGRFKMPHIKFPSFGFSKPEITAPKISGNINLPSVDIDVTKPNVDINVPDMSADVTSAAVKLPETDLAVSGEAPAVDIKGYSVDVEGPDVDIGIKGKGTEVEGQGSKFKLPKFGISLPKTKGPAVDFSVSKPDVDISLPEVTAEAKLPGVVVEGPSVEGTIDIPELDSKDVDVKVKKPKISLPKFGFSKPDVKAPEIDISLPKGEISLAGGSVEVKKPEMDITAPDIDDKEDSDIKGSPSKFKVPTLKLPKFGITAPKVKAEVTDLSADITVPEIETPSGKAIIDQEGIGIEIEKPAGKFQLPKIKIPNIDVKVPTLKGPEMSQEIPKAEYKISVPDKDIVLQETKVDIKGSSFDGQAEFPDIEAGAGEQGRFKMPHIKFPSFGFSKPEITAPKISGNINLPSVDIDVIKPNVDINVPDMSADVTSAAVKLPGTDLAVSGQAPAVDIKGYSVDVEGPDVDIGIKGKGTELEGQGSKFKLPKFGISFPKTKGPAVDISVSKPDVDISLPEVTAEAKLPGVEVEGPSVEGTIDIPELDSKEVDVKVKKPKISLPKFGFSKPDVKAPEIDISLPKGDISLAGRSVEVRGPEVDIKAPDTQIEIKDKDMDIVGSPTKFKLPTIKFPKFGISAPKITTESTDIKIDVKLPEMETSEKVKVAIPEVDMSLPESKVDVKGPEVAIKTQETEANVQVDIGGSPSKFKLPTFKLPKFGISGSKVKGETLEVSAEYTEPDIEALSGKVDVKYDGQGMDIEKPEGKFELPKVKMPDISFSLPKAKGIEIHQEIPKVESNITVPETEIVLKEPKLELKGMHIDGQAEIPDIEAGASEKGRFKMPHIKFPSFGFSKPEITAPKISGNLNLPSVDIAVTKPNVDINVPDMSADVTSAAVKLPETDLAVSGEAPAVDIKGYSVDVAGPDVDIGIEGKGTELEGQGSKFKLPKFGISFPKTKGPAVDISVSKPDVDISLPKVTAEAKLPGVDVEGPSVEGTIDIPELDSKEVDVKVKKPKISLPKFGFSKPDVEAPEIDISLPKGDISLAGGSVEVRGPEVDIKAPDTQIEIKDKDMDIVGSPTKFKLPTIKFPKFGISAPKITTESTDIKTDVKMPEMETSAKVKVAIPEVDMSLPESKVDVKGPEVAIKTQETEANVQVDIGGSPSKFKLPTFKLPKFGISGSKVKGETLEVSAEYTEPDIEALSGKVDVKYDGQGMDIEKPEGKFELPKVKMPDISFSLPKAKGIEIHQEIPKVESNITVPETEIVLKEPKLELKGMHIDGQAEIPDIEAGASEKGRFKMPHIKFPSFGFSKPEITAPKISGNLNLPSVDIAVTKPNVDINVPDMSADVTSAAVKLPETDLAVSGEAPAVDIKGYSVDVAGPDVDIGIEGKGTELEGQGSKFKLPKFGISFPKTKGPAVDISVSKPDVDISLPKVTAEAKLPGVDVEGPSVEGTIDIPELDSKEVDVKVKKPKISLPKFGFSKPDVEAPEIDISLPKGDISLAGGSVEVRGPEVDIKAPDTQIEIKDKDMDIVGSPTKFKLPTIKFPKFGISAPKITTESTDIKTDVKMPEMETSAKVKVAIPEVDMSLPESKVDVKGPEVAIKTQETEANVQVDIGGSPSKFKLPTFKLPKFGISGSKVKGETLEVSAECTEPEIEALSGKVDVKHDGQGMDIEKPEGKFELPKVKMPDISFSLPKAKGIEIHQEIPKVESNITVPETEIVLKEPKFELKGMHIDGQAEIPDIEAGASEKGRFKMPHIKFPSFGFSKPEITAPKISGNLNLPSVDIAVTKPNVDINVPDMSADVTSAAVKLPETDLAVSGEAPAVDIKGYSVDVAGPDVDIGIEGKGTELEGQGSKFKLPKFGISFPKTKGPAVDISVSKPDVDISLPKVTAEAKLPGVDVEGPSVEGTIDIPELDSKEVDVKVKKPKISLPKFGFSKPDVKAPEIDISLPKGDISLAGGSVEVRGPEVDIKAPDTQIEIKDKDMDIVGSPTKFKLPTIKFPKFGISAPKITTESTDIKTDVKLPEMETSDKVKVAIPEVDMSLPESKVDVKGPEVAIKTQETEANVQVNIGGSPSKFKLPSFKLPKFGFSGSKVKGETLEVSAECTEPDIEALSGKVDVKHDGQGMDIEKPEGKFELPKVKMPDISFSLPKAKGIEIPQEIHKGESNITVPETEIVLKEPKLELKGMHIDGQAEIPDIETGVGEQGKFKMPHIKMPSFGFSRPEITGPTISGDVHLPSVDISVTKPDTEINVPHISAGVTSVGVKHPEPELTMPGETPAVDMKDYSVAVEGPEVDIEMRGKGTELEGQGSKFKLPKFGISFPKTKGPAVDISVSKPDVDITLPEVTAEAKLPGVEVVGPSVEGTVAIPEVDSKEVDVKVKKSKISFPKFGFSKPDVKAPEIDISLPKGDISLAGGSVDVRGPEVDIKAPDTQIETKDKDMDIVGSPTKFKLPTIKFPKFGISAPKVTADPSNAKIDITVPELETSSGQLKVDVGAPSFGIDKSSVDLDKTKGKNEMSKMEMPGIDVSLPKVEGLGVSLKTPTTETDSSPSKPIIDIETESGVKGKFQFPHIKMPSFRISKPELKDSGVDISASKPDVDISSPEVTVETRFPGVEIEGPSIEANVDVPEKDVKEVDLKVKKPRISFPKFGFSKPDVPEIDVNLPKGDISLTEGSVEVKGPEVDIKAPDTQIELKDKDMDIVGSPTKFKLPTFKFPTFGSPKNKVETQEVSANITAPEIEPPLGKAEMDVGAPEFETDVLRIEIEKSEGTVKLPKLKMTSIDMSLPKVQGPESKPEDEMSAMLPQVKTDISEVEATGTAIEAKVDKGSPSKFKLPTFKMPKFGFSTGKVKTTDTDVDTGLKTPEVTFEGATKEIEKSIDDGTSNVTGTDKKSGDAEDQQKSSKLNLPKFGDVFRGFDIEFNVPTLEEVEESLASPREEVADSGKNEQSTHSTSAEKDSNIKYQSHTDPSQIQLSTSHHGADVSIQAPTIIKEAETKEQSKFKFRFPRLGFTESSEQDNKTESIHVNVEEKEKSLESQEEKAKEDMKEKETDKGTWFKFPKFGITSPSKTIKDSEKHTSQPSESIDKSVEGDIEEEEVSLTSSVRSSDAFADISSAVTSEQPGPSVVSPTKVKVKISEPTAMVGISEVKVPTDIITSTARTELILLEPHLPEKVDTVTIPVSSEATLTSPDELTQVTEGDIHVVTSNIQATPSSEHAKVITKYETHSVQAMSLQTMAVKVGSGPWTVEGFGEGLGESSEENILVEKHIVKEKSGDDKGAVVITQRVTQIVGATSGEPILDDTASAIKKLRDTMHSEKMKFFEDAETSTITVSTHKIEKHVLETSTEKKCV